MKNYSTEEAAFRRVEILRRQGIWPGVIKIGSGKAYRLTHDPYDETGDEQ